MSELGEYYQDKKSVQERIKADAKTELIRMDRIIKEGVTEESRHYFLEGIQEGYIAGATAVHERAQVEIERRNKLLEDDLKRQCRLNMPGISEQDQEAAWQAFKTKHNL